MKIVVIGGTGLIGPKLVTKLGEHGHEMVAASPNTGVNTLTGEGLADALVGASVVIDVSNSPSLEDSAVMRFFETSTRNLLAAEAVAGVAHHVALSVVGTERLPESGYIRAKIAQEQLIEKSSIPYSIVHATQFFEFVGSIADAATAGGTVRMAPVFFQPIAGDDVAQAVGRTSIGSPLNGRVEVAGPERFRMDEFFREALAARHDPREVVTDHHARYFGAELSEGTLVPGSDAILAETRYRDWSTRRARWTPPPPTVADLARQLRDAVADLPRFLTAPLLRRRHRTWGATPAEITATMPGDDLLPRAQYRSTRAITIAATPEEVWPWLVQVGCGRAGWYADDLLDNFARPSARRIIPELQDLEVGQWLLMVLKPSERMSFIVDSFARPQWLLWRSRVRSWSWRLIPLPDGRTRLITRLNTFYDWRRPGTLVTVLLMEFGDYAMMRRMLRGIRERAEAERQRPA